jgi:hypothetical protein
MMNLSFTFPQSDPTFGYKLLSDLAPHILWAVVILAVFWMVGPKRVAAAILNARKISFGGIELDLKGDISDAARAKNLSISPRAQDQVTLRAERLLPQIRGFRLLWIDDVPARNENEMRLLSRIGIMIDLAKSDAEAEQRLAAFIYDVVVSDWERSGVADAGKAFLPKVRQAPLSPPLIFYVGQERDVPVGAFGLTTRPDELLNLLLDVLERKGN